MSEERKLDSSYGRLLKAQTARYDLWMNRKLFAPVSCLLFALLFLSSCAQKSGTQNTTTSINQNNAGSVLQTPPAQIVRAEASPVEMERGNTSEALIKLSITSGYHINANPASYPYLIQTELIVPSANGVAITGQVIYPQAQTRKFAFDPNPLAVYEGDVTIRAPLSANADANTGAFSLSGKLRAQACDDKQCYPPRTIDVSIPVTIK